MSNPTGFNGKQPGNFSSSWDPNEKTPEFKELQKANKNNSPLVKNTKGVRRF